MRTFFPVKLCFFLFVPLSWAGAAVEVNQNYVLCKNQDVVRSIRVNLDKDGSCRTVYTKAGVDRVVGNAKNQSSCESFLENIKGNLEGAAWQCREVGKSKITVLSSSAEEAP